MSMHTRVRLVILGTFLSIIFVLHECIKLNGYKFPVYSTPFCPRDESEWDKRSTVLNCNKTHGYTCLPNEKLTELLEFCYTQPWLLIEEGYCLYLERKGSYVDSYSCRHFLHGCHNTSYLSTRIFENPACISISNGCFLAEQSCTSSPNTTHLPKTTDDDKNDWLLMIILIGILEFIVCFSSFMMYIYCKKRICTQCKDIERAIEPKEKKSLIENQEDDSFNKESGIDEAMFDQWKQEDSCFISTKTCKELEKIVKHRNLVIVAGHSGSGKSAIIQHIALKYKEQGWTVRRVKVVKDILDYCYSSRFQKNKTFFVLNDPLGKEAFDEILNKSWQTYKEEELKVYLEKAKIMMSCRSHILFDARFPRYLVNQSHIVNIDDSKNKLSVFEKRQILNKYTSAMNLSEKDCYTIVAVERYFPLLCKLYSSKEENKKKGILFFTEPVAVLKEIITGYRKNDNRKYCALALLVLFNDDLCIGGLLKNKEKESKLKCTLELCGLPEETPLSAIGDYLNSIQGSFIKKVGNTYNFYHDFVMEVTTHVFGTDYPIETIKYADIGFLRRRVRLEDCEEHKDSFTIYLKDQYIKEIGKRLYTELFGERLLDVVLNPCLRNEKVIKVLKETIAGHPENLQMLLKTKELPIDKHVFDMTSKSELISKLDFLVFHTEVCPLFLLVVFCHTQLSQYCINTLQQKQIDLTSSFLFSAMCCNGSIELFNGVFKNNADEFLEKTWGGLYPIHIVSVFLNYDLLRELINIGGDVNQKTGNSPGGFTALMLAVSNDIQEYGNINHVESGESRRNKTVQLLLSNGADINLCMNDGASPLYIACQNGHDSTVQLLLSNGANFKLCMIDGASPLYIACQNGHDSTVKLLLSNGADTNSCMEDGVSPLYIACQNGHDSTVQLLLSNGADITLCMDDGVSPLYIACQNGHDSTVQFLLSNGADINLCSKDGTSPIFIACENGQDSTVRYLLNGGAGINSREKEGASPLYIACQNGHDSTVQLLLRNGADISLCKENGASPLFIACENGHDSIVKLLLSNGADINLCRKDGTSPLRIAIKNGHESTKHILLSNGANTNYFQRLFIYFRRRFTI